MSAVENPDKGSVWLHATAIVVGENGILLRGTSGVGKSSFAALLLQEAARDGRFARLVGDDRVSISGCHGRLIARAHPTTAGRLERRGLGIVAVPFEPACVVQLVVDLCAAGETPPRMPRPDEARTTLCGLAVPRLALRCFPDGQASQLVWLKIGTG